MKRTLKILGGLCVVAVFAAAGLFGTDLLMSGDASSSGSGSGGVRPTRVGVASPELRTIDDAVSAVGTLRPIRSVDVATSVPGRVTEVPVSSGQQVGAGDLLVQLDDRSERATLAEVEATLGEARQSRRRIEELADSNTAAETRLEEARAAFERAEAAVMVARADLEDRAITAPFAGTVGVIDLEPGAFLEAGSTISQLSDLSVVEVSVSLPERYFQRVAPGQTVTVTTPAYANERFEGRVTLRAPQINLASRSFDIRAEIDNADRRLVGGMFANSRVILDTYDGLAIPDNAIISEGLSSYVYTVSDGKAARTEVEPGTSLDSMTEVRDGLSAGDRVVVAGWDRLSDDAAVEIDDDIARQGLN